ncbi:hypothetical protein BT69DRAFT_1322632 [Atractiella rhizophila]|nr:hypothetical protein BT69DRAFT_1322632 [Atractiella rhizophila]
MSSFPRPDGEQPKSRPTSQYSHHSNTSSAGYQHWDSVPASRIRANPPPEHFVIVRPPPSNTTHPLNLQVQLLLTPNVKSASRSSTVNSINALQSPSELESGLRDSFTAVAVTSPVGTLFPGKEPEGGENSRDAGDSRLSRSPSTSSRGSIASTAESTNSVTRKSRVMALYNLSWHNVLTTTVTDSGTDEKIAKFLRRGESIEIIGLNEIIPIPVFSSPAVVSATPSSTSLYDSKREEGPSIPPQTSSFFGRFKKTFLPKADPLTGTNSVRSSIDGSKLNILNRNKSSSSMANSEVNLAFAEEGTEDVKRAKAYRWVVKRWIKQGMEGAEWSLEWKKKRRQSERRRTEGEEHKSKSSQRDHSRALASAGQETNISEDLEKPASGVESVDESDPEDSESPWICQLQLPNSRGVMLSNLSPAPHHPRIIAQLTMPYNLRSEGGLTVEELKDMVFVTSLWLLIRERLGGLGMKRKGDSDRRSGLKLGVTR